MGFLKILVGCWLLVVEKFSVNKIKFISLLYWVAYYGVTVVLLFSGVAKVIDSTSMIATLTTAFYFLPIEINIAISTFLPVFEIILAVFLFVRKSAKLALYAIALLFFTFLLFAIYGSILKISSSCGCFGSAMEDSFGILMIARNFLLVVIALLLCYQTVKYENCAS